MGTTAPERVCAVELREGDFIAEGEVVDTYFLSPGLMSITAANSGEPDVRLHVHMDHEVEVWR